MANWISSKLKVAETFFEQIDQQAAESLKKERSLGSEDQKFNLPTKEGGNGGGTVPLKDQLKKKTSIETNGHEYIAKLKTDPNINSFSNRSSNGDERDNGVANVPNSSPKPKPTLSESDWTELLSTPIQATPSSNRSNGASSVIREVRRNGRKLGNSRSNLPVQERKKNMNSGGVKSKKGLDIPLGNKLNGKRSDEDGSSSSARSSSVELQGDGKVLGREELNNKDVGSSKMEKQSNNENERNGGLFESKQVSEEDHLRMVNNSHSLEMSSVSDKVDRVSDRKKGVGNAYDRLRSTVKGKRQSAYASRSSVSDDLKKGFSTSDEGSASDSDSVSTSDSESEQERERREKILAEKAAARAVEAIKERENMAARLEGEKQSLEKILEERAKQQAREVIFHFCTLFLTAKILFNFALVLALHRSFSMENSKH